MEYEEIKLTDFPPTKIYVLLDEELRKKLIEIAKIKLNLKNNYTLSQWINKKSIGYALSRKFNNADVDRWIIGSCLDERTNKIHQKSMPLWVVLELAKVTGISIEELERNVISYRSGGSGNLIFMPKLPIKITPELESIIFHLFGDGHVGKFTPSFYQKNEIANKQFLNKLKNCFGNFKENIPVVNQIRFPKAITDILSNFYDIKSYYSDKIRIPTAIYKTDKLSKVACITAFILDEGTIRDVISIASKNDIFLNDLKQLMNDCGYESKDVKPHTPSNTFYLNLANGTIEKFYKDYSDLISLYPNCSLANKHDRLFYLISRRKNKSKMLEIDNEILNLLQKEKLTTKEIAEKLGFANCTILHHLEKLYKSEKISRRPKDKGFVWLR